MNNPNQPIKDITCQNCGHPLRGDENYCPYCGQKNDVRPLSIKNYFQNLTDNFFSLDNKVFKTALHLIKYPAKVPLDYIRGKRTGYSNPFRFLLQVSLLYFLLAGVIDFFTPPETESLEMELGTNQEKKTHYYPQLDSLDQQIHFIKSLRNPALSTQAKDSISKTVLNHQSFKNETNFLLDKQSVFSDYLTDHHVAYTYYPALENPSEFENLSFFLKVKTLIGLLNNTAYKNKDEKELIKLLHLNDNWSNKLALIVSKRLLSLIDNPYSRDVYKRAIISKITLGLFFMLPLFSFLVYLLYRKHDYSFTETLVFIFYLQSIYFVLMTLDLFISLFPDSFNWISIFLELLFIFFLIKNFKAFYYEKSKTNTLKVVFLIIPFYLLLSGIGFVVISLLSLVI